jgi:small-conductance mechanosensitive channel
MFKCKICNSEYLNLRKLSKHIRDKHKNFTVKEYYDTYCKKENEENCLICHNKTDYSGLGTGYKETCSSSCAAKLSRLRLKQDTERFNNFTKKISNCVKKEWQTNDQTIRIKNMTKTVRENVKKLSSEEKRERYGYLNKLPEKERNEIIKNMTENGFLKWWKNATYEEKRSAWDKRNVKLIELWEKYGEELYKKQRETFSKRKKENDDIFDMTEKQREILFNNLNKIFNG